MNVTITQTSVEVTDRGAGDLDADDLHKVVRSAGRHFGRLFNDLFRPSGYCPPGDRFPGPGAIFTVDVA